MSLEHGFSRHSHVPFLFFVDMEQAPRRHPTPTAVVNDREHAMVILAVSRGTKSMVISNTRKREQNDSSTQSRPDRTRGSNQPLREIYHAHCTLAAQLTRIIHTIDLSPHLSILHMSLVVINHPAFATAALYPTT